MNKINLVLVFMLASMFASLASAGAVADISVKELAQLIKAKKVTVLDANGAKTRKEHGAIPGAVMLSSYDGYNISKELPQNKGQKLVFYCANTKCSAAPEAAKRATAAGYTDVAHLSVGIMGWNKAGQKSTKIN